jgi:hypothetical protein
MFYEVIVGATAIVVASAFISANVSAFKRPDVFKAIFSLVGIVCAVAIIWMFAWNEAGQHANLNLYADKNVSYDQRDGIQSAVRDTAYPSYGVFIPLGFTGYFLMLLQVSEIYLRNERNRRISEDRRGDEADG